MYVGVLLCYLSRVPELCGQQFQTHTAHSGTFSLILCKTPQGRYVLLQTWASCSSLMASSALLIASNSLSMLSTDGKKRLIPSNHRSSSSPSRSAPLVVQLPFRSPPRLLSPPRVCLRRRRHCCRLGWPPRRDEISVVRCPSVIARASDALRTL